ncbi:hypothetical protein BC939DRAFT_454188 [Gamsiella multidivaricata]|uniref:uncharacterized protein n=1 Tax=Gamsiella multidivaricata TaxID=101098 RepID=UPI00221F9C6B|nr:uncharacterized protein BC939DRAFT_454188 [Gamsiella multidivaricata]KAG0371103.1 hypothetical protein BGZ54_000047 [Gamsiella multidivaricata]KAI7822170.1 hypothetical protein BC939DRAFT_454188 [Gamsiella multidivaricata]
MLRTTSRTVRVSGVVLTVLLTLFLLGTVFHRPSLDRRTKRLRVEEPVVVILVHPSPSLSKATNFELKRAIARTWAKDAEDVGASVFFVGEHEGETVMRRPSEFQGRAHSPSSRFGPGTHPANAGVGAGAGTGGAGYSKEDSMRKMLIPSVLENGQADNPSGLLKAYHFLYNNTNWFAGPIFQTYPFILTTDTTHYIHVENLVSTLLSSKPRRLLTMKDDLAFSGLVSEASECSADDYGDKAPLQSTGENNNIDNDSMGSPVHSHWTLSRTHLVTKQLVAMLGPHLRHCIKAAATSFMDSGEAFQDCVKEWASHPLFWKDGYCGRLAARRYQAPAPGSNLKSSSSTPDSVRNERSGSPPTPQEFEEFYLMKQEERAMEHLNEDGGKKAGREAVAAAAESEERLLRPRGDNQEKESSRRLLQQLTSSSSGSSARWIVASGLTQPEDFTLVYQSLVDREEEEEDYVEDLDY